MKIVSINPDSNLCWSVLIRIFLFCRLLLLPLSLLAGGLEGWYLLGWMAGWVAGQIVNSFGLTSLWVPVAPCGARLYNPIQT